MWNFLAVALAQDTSIEQTQALGQLRVQVFDDQEDALAIPWATLQLSAHGSVGDRISFEMHTDADGQALFIELAPGLYTIVVSKEGFNSITIDMILVNPERTTLQHASLSSADIII